MEDEYYKAIDNVLSKIEEEELNLDKCIGIIERLRSNAKSKEASIAKTKEDNND